MTVLRSCCNLLASHSRWKSPPSPLPQSTTCKDARLDCKLLRRVVNRKVSVMFEGSRALRHGALACCWKWATERQVLKERTLSGTILKEAVPVTMHLYSEAQSVPRKYPPTSPPTVTWTFDTRRHESTLSCCQILTRPPGTIFPSFNVQERRGEAKCSRNFLFLAQVSPVVVYYSAMLSALRFGEAYQHIWF